MMVPVLHRIPLVFAGALVIMLAIFGPVILAEKFQDIEVTGEGLVPFSEVIERYEETLESTYVYDNQSFVSYQPWRELNHETSGHVLISGQMFTDPFYRTGGGAYYPLTTDYDILGYRDTLYIIEPASQVHVMMNIDADFMLTNNVYSVYLHLETLEGSLIDVSTLAFKELTPSYEWNIVDGYILDKSYLTLVWPEYSEHTFWINLTPTDLNNLASNYADVPVDRQILHLVLVPDQPCTLQIDLQIGSEVFQELSGGYWQNETLIQWDNYTSTYYVPYYSPISNPYYLTRLSFLGSSGILGILTFLFWRGY